MAAMIALPRQAGAGAYVKPAAGLAAAVSLAMLGFGSGLAVMDHATLLAQRQAVELPGSFNSGTQGDYRVAPPQRYAPQRTTTR